MAPQLQQALEEHLQTCETCRTQSAIEQALDDALARLPRYQASESFKDRLRELVKNDAPSRPHASALKRGRKLGWAAGALSVAALAAVSWWHTSHTDVALVSEAVNDHLRVLYAERPLEIENGGIHQVKPWFSGRLDFAPSLDFAGDDEFPLQGGAVAVFVDRKAAAFVFKRRLHVITAFVFRASGLPWSLHGNAFLGQVSASLVKSRGFNVLLWQNGDLGYALVSDVNQADLVRLGTKITASRAQ